MTKVKLKWFIFKKLIKLFNFLKIILVIFLHLQTENFVIFLDLVFHIFKI